MTHTPASTSKTTVVGIVPVGALIKIMHDGHPHDGMIARIAAIQSPTGGMGGSAGVALVPVGDFRHCLVSRYTRVIVP